MTDLEKAARMALEALFTYEDDWVEDGMGGVHHNVVYDERKVFNAIAALRQALEQPAQQEPTVENNSQNWRGMDGTTAYWLIQRHADGWADIGKMMSEWLAANQPQPEQQEPVDWEAVAADQAMTIAMMKGAQEVAVLAEREACAQVCDDRDMGDCNREDMEARACAAAIRERGQA